MMEEEEEEEVKAQQLWRMQAMMISDGGGAWTILVVFVLRALSSLCLLMAVMLFVERVYMTVVLAVLKLKQGGVDADDQELQQLRKPTVMGLEEADEEMQMPSSSSSSTSSSSSSLQSQQHTAAAAAAAHPMVLVQIPMYNEKEVYQVSIGAACGLTWPADRLVVQVLDDSTDESIRKSVERECALWRSGQKRKEAEGNVNVKYERRKKREGYKAGALKEGMSKWEYVGGCEYVVIFDADFRPEPDFLLRTIPILQRNPDLALVQARWTFVNSDDCMLTRMQQMSLDYHFSVEQRVGSFTHRFFGFNGTAGVWRISAINDAGGWKDRTTVEDMDLSIRASLRGWNFLYLHPVQVKSELPSTFKAYRFQQHRWSCGPANLFRKTFLEIVRCKKVPASKKLYVLYSFFFVRKIVSHVVTFVFFCVVIPATALFPELQIPSWGAVYLPCAITVLNALATPPRSLHLFVLWLFFENVMSLHRIKATLIGLLEAGRANEWVVTQKLGRGDNAQLLPLAAAGSSSPSSTKTTTTSSSWPWPWPWAWAWRRRAKNVMRRIEVSELGVGMYLLLCACCDLAYVIRHRNAYDQRHHYYMYLFPQAFAFFVIGFGYVGI